MKYQILFSLKKKKTMKKNLCISSVAVVFDALRVNTYLYMYQTVIFLEV